MARALSKVAVSVPEVDEQLQPFFDKTHSGLAGAAIMAVNKNGEVIYGNAFGRVTYEHAKDRPMTMDTICWLGTPKILFLGQVSIGDADAFMPQKHVQLVKRSS